MQIIAKKQALTHFTNAFTIAFWDNLTVSFFNFLYLFFISLDALLESDIPMTLRGTNCPPISMDRIDIDTPISPSIIGVIVARSKTHSSSKSHYTKMNIS